MKKTTLQNQTHTINMRIILKRGQHNLVGYIPQNL